MWDGHICSHPGVAARDHCHLMLGPSLLHRCLDVLGHHFQILRVSPCSQGEACGHHTLTHVVSGISRTKTNPSLSRAHCCKYLP